MQLIRSIAANTFFQVLSRVISSGTSFLITILVARNFGVTGYGDLAKITAFVSLFYLLIDLGLNAVFLQFDDSEKKFKDLLSFRIILSVMLFFIVGVVALFLPYNQATGIGYSPFVKVGIIFFALTFFGQAFSFSTGVIFQKNYAYKLSAYSTAAGSFFTLFIISISALLHLSIFFIIAAYVFGSFMQGIIGLFLVKENLFPISLDRKFIKQMLIPTLPITAMLLLNLIYFRIDSILLALFKSTKDVALYDLAYKVFDFLIALPLFLSNTIYPQLLYSEKNTRIRLAKVNLYVAIFILIGILIAIPLWFLSPLLSIIKTDFSQAALPLKLLILSLPIFFATSILQWILIAKKKQLFLLFVYALSMIINIFLNVFFIPQYSYVASAIITGVSEGIVMILLGSYLLFSNNQ